MIKTKRRSGLYVNDEAAAENVHYQHRWLNTFVTSTKYFIPIPTSDPSTIITSKVNNFARVCFLISDFVICIFVSIQFPSFRFSFYWLHVFEVFFAFRKMLLFSSRTKKC